LSARELATATRLQQPFGIEKIGDANQLKGVGAERRAFRGIDLAGTEHAGLDCARIGSARQRPRFRIAVPPFNAADGLDDVDGGFLT
jgi:hypothetical protein